MTGETFTPPRLAGAAMAVKSTWLVRSASPGLGQRICMSMGAHGLKGVAKARGRMAVVDEQGRAAAFRNALSQRLHPCLAGGRILEHRAVRFDVMPHRQEERSASAGPSMEARLAVASTGRCSARATDCRP